jgi:membrane-bound lytic murein transglycosylase A
MGETAPETGHPAAELHPVQLEPVSLLALEGWAEDDHAAAFRTFRAGAERILASPPKTRPLGADAASLQRLADLATGMDAGLDGAQARRFFQTHFAAQRISAPGFVPG